MSLESRIAEMTAGLAKVEALLERQCDLLARNNQLLEQNATIRANLAAAVPAGVTSAIPQRPAAPPAVPAVAGGQRHREAAALGKRPVGRPPKPRPGQPGGPDIPARIEAPAINDGHKTVKTPDGDTDDDRDVTTHAPVAAPAAPPQALAFDIPSPGTPQARAADLIRAEIDPDTVDENRMKSILGALCDAKVFPETLESRRDIVRDAMIDASPDPQDPYTKFTLVDPQDYPAMFASLAVRLGVMDAVPAQADPEPQVPESVLDGDVVDVADEGEDWP